MNEIVGDWVTRGTAMCRVSSEAFTAQTVQEQSAPSFTTLRTGVLVLWPQTIRGSVEEPVGAAGSRVTPGLGSVEESVCLGRRSLLQQRHVPQHPMVKVC